MTRYHPSSPSLSPGSRSKRHGHQHLEPLSCWKKLLSPESPLLYLQTAKLFYQEPPLWRSPCSSCIQPWKDQGHHDCTLHQHYHCKYAHWVRLWKVCEGAGREREEIHWVAMASPISYGSQWKRWSIFLDQEVETTTSSLVIASVLVANKSERAIHFPIHLQYGARTVVTTTLVDCGATGNFIDPSLVHWLLLPSRLILPLQALNIDRTPHKQGQITAATCIHCQATAFEDSLSLMIVGLGWAQVILGMPWLTKNNPWIDWIKKTIRFNEEHIQKTTLSTELTITTHKEEVTLPPQYTDYADVFSKRTFDVLPPKRDFDHAINLKELFVPKVTKVYPSNPQEVDTCKEFVETNLKTGRIQPSKSLQASPFFFIKKKDGKLRPVQDYQYLNNHMVKNAYPLPLVSNLVNNLRCFSCFTKFNVHWGTTTSASKTVTNGKPHLLPQWDCANQQ